MSKKEQPIFILLLLSVAVVFLSVTNITAQKQDLKKFDVVKNESVLIPAGEFLMGSDNLKGDNPAHKVYIKSFCMDKYEVTNAQYLMFCQKTGRSLPEFWGQDLYHCSEKFPNHPVVGVSWEDAVAYAKWEGKRLPTEAEWEYAARGDQKNMDYPWGNSLTPSHANYYRPGTEGTRPVGSYPPNGYGLYDMAGNVVEWIHDIYDQDYYRKSPYKNPKGPKKGRFRVIRGGGWHSGPSCNMVFYRNALPSNWVDFNVGFRCAKDARGK